MKTTSKCLAVLACLTGPIATNASTVTLNYQGQPFTSESLSVISPGVSPNVFPFAGIGESITASIVLSDPLPTNGTETVTPLSYSFAVGGVQVVNTDLYQQGYGSGGNLWYGGPNGLAAQSVFSFTTVNGVITGYSLYEDVDNHSADGPVSSTLSLSSSGTSNILPVANGSNDYYIADYLYDGVYRNDAGYYTVGSNRQPGTWTVVASAPEIDPASAASGLTLLFGGLAMLRGRRVRISLHAS